MAKDYISKEKNFISVVVYMYNAEAYIQNFLQTTDNLLKEKFEAYEFILVNDASSDTSVKKVAEVAQKISGNVSIVNLAWKHNIELAMLAGVDIAIGDFVFEFDTPVMDYQINTIWELYQRCLKGFDVVAASSNRPLKPSSKIFYKYLNKVSYRKMELTTETFRIISRRALNRVLRSKERLRYRKAIYHYSGFETSILNYDSINNNIKLKELGVGDKLELASDVLIGFSNIGTRISSTISSIFFIISILAGIYTIKSYLTIENIQPGWTTTMLFLSASFTGMFLILALLSKYMTAVLAEVQDKPKYIYRSIDRLSRK